MTTKLSSTGVLGPREAEFYRPAVQGLVEAGLPFLLGGAFALRQYTGIVRDTKDLDLFVKPADCPRILEHFARQGYRTEMTDKLWLAKVFSGDEFIDLIFNSSKGLGEVDDRWFRHQVSAELFDLPVGLCAPEEIIWSKSFVVERERYDGADIAHLIRACGRTMDWDRLVARYDGHWRVLLSYLVLFGYIYPGERDTVPGRVMTDLLGRLRQELAEPVPDVRLCQGTLLSHYQFEVDVNEWGYEDARPYKRKGGG